MLGDVNTVIHIARQPQRHAKPAKDFWSIMLAMSCDSPMAFFYMQLQACRLSLFSIKGVF